MDTTPPLDIPGFSAPFQIPDALADGARGNGSGHAPAADSRPAPQEQDTQDRAATPSSRLRPNRLEWRGRLAADPELRHARSGIDVCAVRVVQTVLDTHRQPITQGIEVVMFRERARDFARTFRKGDYIEVYGELRIRHRQDEAGRWHTDVTLYPTEEPALISRPRRP